MSPRRMWQDWEIEYLRENFTFPELDNIAKFLNRAPSTVAAKAYSLGYSTKITHPTSVSVFLAGWPLRPLRITRQLNELAESNPTPEEYEERKTQILKG